MTDYKDDAIMVILLRKRRPMSAKKITEILNQEGTEISRPTVARRLAKLKEDGWVVGSARAYRINPKRMPDKFKKFF